MLRFHPATEILLRFLHPEVEVLRVGPKESWCRGWCVVLRQELLVSRSPHATFACSTGYTARALRKVILREFLRKDPPPESSVFA